MNLDDWERELVVYRKEFIKLQGWNDKQAESYIRDGWACLRDGRLAILSAEEEAPLDALPVFQFRTPQGWRLPVPLQLHLSTLLRPKEDAPSGGLGPRERVFALIAKQGPPPKGDLLKRKFKASELKRVIAQQAASRLEDICDSDEFETADDSVWQAILAAIQFGRRQLLAEIFADEEAMQENMRGRLMNRKGKSSKGRKRAEVPQNKFRKRVQNLVREGLKAERNAGDIRAFVEKTLSTKGMKREGENYIFGGVMAKKETVRKWVREERKKQLRN